MNAQQQSQHTLKRRVIIASAWVFGGHFVAQVIRLGSNLIMTRLLVPEMFGVMAVANVLIVGLTLFSDVGLQQNIIQSHRGNDPDFLNTSWTIQIIRGGFIWLLALLLALILYLMNQYNWIPSESVYSEPVTPYIVVTLSFSALINGFNSTRLAEAYRGLKMRRIIGIEIASQIAAILLMITWALIDRSIWALVAGALFGAATKMLLSHNVLPGDRNRLHWDWSAFYEIFHFGKWVFISSTLGFFASHGDRLLLGGFVDSNTLGVYAIAYFIVHAIQQMIRKVAGNAAYPALSEIARERPLDLKAVYYKFRKPVDILILLATGFIFVSGSLIIDVLYDDRFKAAGPMIEILCLSLFMERFVLLGQCFIAIGKPKLLVPMLGIRVLYMFVFLPLTYSSFGLVASLWVIASNRLITLPLILYFKVKFNLLDIGKEILVLPFLVIGGLIGLLVNTSFESIFGHF